jgi:hypothetical protein
MKKFHKNTGKIVFAGIFYATLYQSLHYYNRICYNVNRLKKAGSE